MHTKITFSPVPSMTIAVRLSVAALVELSFRSLSRSCPTAKCPTLAD